MADVDDIPAGVARAVRGTEGAPAAAHGAPPWLLRQRVTVPDRPAGFHVRPGLAARCVPSERRVTLLLAPAGFGKTTLLAACCRDARDRGVPVAWLVLDGRDSPDLLDVYVAYAFKAAGLDVSGAGAGVGEAPYPSAAQALNAVASRSAPVILALDEAEQLADSALGAVIDFVVRSAPVNLHLAIACRELPGGIDVASAVLAHETELLTARDLRFTRKEIAGFFAHELSRREFARVATESQGWPIALRVRRNERRLGRGGGSRVVQDLMGNWIDSRLWSGLDDGDGELLLDIGQLEWFDAGLLDEVVGEAGALDRLRGLRVLDGLLEPIRSDGVEVWRLHPLLQEHCRRRRSRDDPARYRAVHQRAAAALSRRGRVVAALRHARDSGDAAVVASTLLGAGGIRLGVREGTDRLIAINDLLPDEAVAGSPRLALVRCAALAAGGRHAEARRLYATVPADAADVDVSADRCFARAAIADYCCESSMTAEMEEAFGELPRLACAPDLDPLARIGCAYLLGLMHNVLGRPRDAMLQCEHVRQLLAKQYPMSTPTVALQTGLAAMALGRASEARRWYAKSLELATSGFVARPGFVRGINVLIQELQLERDRVDAAAPPPRAGDVGSGVQWHASLASADLAVEHANAVAGIDEALVVIEALSADAQRSGRSTVMRHLAAQRVSLLADAGRVDDAQAAWAGAALPVADGDCIDLARQGWREAESISCARLRLLAALGAFERARRFGRSLLEMAAGRGLVRTVMRARALCLRIEHLADEEERAMAHLECYVAALPDADYVRPLVRETAAAELLRSFVGTCPDAARRRTAERLLARTEEGGRRAVPVLSVRELDVLSRLDTNRDDDIAAALGISRHGVRYHVGNILGKFGVRSRREAVRRARELGVLPRL